MKFSLLSVLLLMIGCTVNQRYPNWQYVRIESTAPANCAYKFQETCSKPGKACFDWYKQRATVYDANTVVLNTLNKDVFLETTGKVNIGDGNTSIADYYFCQGEKNLKPEVDR